MFRQPNVYCRSIITAFTEFLKTSARWVISCEPCFRPLTYVEDEIFQQRIRVKERRPESFAEEQARRARETMDVYISMGEQPIQVMQGD